MFDKKSFSKKLRLLQENQFQTVLTQPAPFLGRYLALYYHANDLNYPRLGIITGKKKIPLAVKRNRIKRQIRESFRLSQDLISGYDVILVARGSAQKASRCELRECSDKLLQQLVLLAKKC